ncbi:MAG: SDR family oxidoreductase [Chloroflexi bacterium]|nr:SDR family oxidoreductase [Chloroflexota bacterium]
MGERTYLVTGANTGIGFATALGLAEQGQKVVMAARNMTRGEPARREVIRMSGNEDVHLIAADFGSLADVRRMADEFARDYERLEGLINNAAVIPPTRQTSEDGFELQFSVNHLAPFLLTNLLLDMLKASAPARVVNVSSDVHAGGRIDLDDLQSEAGYRPNRVYASTKLMNVLFTFELARRLAGSGVTANALHPGVINTQLYQAYMGRKASPEDLADWRRGAETVLYVATAPELEQVTGLYFSNRRVVPPAEAAQEERLARELWARSAALCGLAS